MNSSQLRSLLARREGALKLAPTLVHRFYPDFNRLQQKKLKRRANQFIPERWIGSSVEAINPAPIPSGGLSMLAEAEEPTSLREAVRRAPEALLGEAVAKRHGAEFRCLVKLLDPGEPIVFHIHATDRQVKTMPKHFRGHRFGKDEAYYYLDAPKGPMPYTHAGLFAGVGKKELMAAVGRGREAALELSPSFYQHLGEGFFVPAGVPHRPGTALTLEIQQPSDVYTLLETHAAGKAMPPEQIHPGFKSLEEAYALVDWKQSRAVGEMTGHRLAPQRVSGSGGNEVAWVFPLERCIKFGGKRLRIGTRLTYQENLPCVLWFWKGAGMLNGQRVRAGDEFFIPYPTAAAGIELVNTGEQGLEAFSFFPGA
jgi:hypothetical protein